MDMPPDQNLDQAIREHRDVVSRVQNIRDGLTNDIINPYYDDPTSAEDASRMRDRMRGYLLDAVRSIDALLDGPLR